VKLGLSVAGSISKMQKGKPVEELDAQWYDYPGYWDRIHRLVEPIDELIEAFNEKTGLLKDL